MSPGRGAPRRKKTAAEGGSDLLSALPDGPLQTVLSFLPSRDAVRTSVLSRRWRNQWKYVPVVRITDVWRYQSAEDLNSFVNSFLHSRHQLPINVMEIDRCNADDEEIPAASMFIEQWIRYGLSNQAQSLLMCSEATVERWPLPNDLINSQHLLKLDLDDLHLEFPCLDFSSCPALVDLKMTYCAIEVKRIVSPSVKRLSITFCDFNSGERTRICFPRLTSLILADCYYLTPVLERMPLLDSAFVRLQTCLDCCNNKYETGNCGDNRCHGCADNCHYSGINSCVLEGLSASKSLELTSQQREFIFRKDLKCCPTFSKLKTLLLNDWCMTATLDALLCFIKHAPVLDKLTLQFPKMHEDFVNNGAIYDMAKELVALEHLTVEVKCHEVDERILELLDFCGVPSRKIKILPPPELILLEDLHDSDPSISFSFEQKKIVIPLSLDNQSGSC